MDAKRLAAIVFSCRRLTPGGELMHAKAVPAIRASVLLTAAAAVVLASAANATRTRSVQPQFTPHFVEYPLASGSSPLGVTAGADGNIWFTESFSQKIGRITPAGVITEFPIVHPDTDLKPGFIAAGPDGNLWFGESHAGAKGRIARMTPDGTLTEFAVPSGDSPLGIAAGADGNLWFTENFGNRIGRITTAGAITEFPLAFGSYPEGIAAGPDGNLWFVETGGKVGRMTTGGQLTEFPVPAGSFSLFDIAAGPDGNMWFTELDTQSGKSRIGRITPDGAVTQFRLLFPMAAAYGITDGFDGTTWFGDVTNSALGRITPAGRAKEFPTPTSSSGPLGLAVGSDGNLWFSERDANQIGRLRLARSDTRYVLSLDAGFAPAKRFVPLGLWAEWQFHGPNVHSAKDSSGMNLFDTGPMQLASAFRFSLTAAGSYAYNDAETDPLLTGEIDVPLEIAPKAGDTSTVYTVTWASAPPAPGFVSDIQIKRPGSPSFVTWLSGQTGTSADFSPDAGPGTYAFRARLRLGVNHSGWSPARSIVVT
jgi:streptogramin lyase